MNMGTNGQRLPMPQSVPQAFTLDLSDRRLQAVMNLAVFTPYAIYLARGKRPPAWLIAASMAWLAISAIDDLSYLYMGDRQSGFYGLGMAHPGPSGDALVEAQGIAVGARMPPRPFEPPQVAWHRYRVNR